MPGLTICWRKWAIASDEIFIPAFILVIIHFICSVLLITTFSIGHIDPNDECSLTMYQYLLGYLITVLFTLFIEIFALLQSCRGRVNNTSPRRFLQQIIFTRLGICIIEICFLVAGSIYLVKFRNSCQEDWYQKFMKIIVLIILILTSIVIVGLILSIICVFDKSGKAFYLLKKYEKNHYNNSDKKKFRYIQRKTYLSYREDWTSRFKWLCCCVKSNDNLKAFDNIAKNISYLFYRCDLVTSDLLAGLILIREKQQINKINLRLKEGIYDYLSGVPVTESTKFYNLKDKENLDKYQDLIYFFDYAVASYGWPMLIYKYKCECFDLIPNIKCSPNNLDLSDTTIKNDNSCLCNYNALLEQLPRNECSLNPKEKDHIKIIYVDFCSDINKPSYFIAIDFLKSKVVIAIRGTESLTDSITDMQSGAVPIPGVDSSLDWYSHEGITKAAINLMEEFISKNSLQRAFNYDLNRNTDKFELLVVGHSLGAGVGALLSILLRSKYPKVQCYSYSPPGGLLSQPCMEATKEFITTVILGKDMVPRLGMVQLKNLRNEVMESLKCTTKPKWQIFSKLCCLKCSSKKSKKKENLEDSVTHSKSSQKPILRDLSNVENSNTQKFNVSEISATHNGPSKSTEIYSIEEVPLNQTISNDSQIAFSSDTSYRDTSFDMNRSFNDQQNRPQLYPPGRILHVVRKYPRTAMINNRNSINVIMDNDFTKLDRNATIVSGFNPTVETKKSVKFNSLQNYLMNTRLSKSSQALPGPVYQVIEADNKNFNELFISPRMIQDHMPNNLIKCMKAVLEEPAPKKPPRQISKNGSDTDCSYEENSMTDFSQFEIPLEKIPSMKPKQNYTDLFSCLKNPATTDIKTYQHSDSETIQRTQTNRLENYLEKYKFKALSVYTRGSQSSTYIAPLAKPESFSDLTTDCEAKERKNSIRRNMRSQKTRMYNMKKNYLDNYGNNSSFNQTLDEEELKSNLVWWPYTESTSNTQINHTDNLNSPKIPKLELNSSSYENFKSEVSSTGDLKKIVINIEDTGDNSDQGITTSTPRTDSNFKDSMHFESSNPYTSNNDKKNSINSVSLIEDNFNTNSSQPFLSIINQGDNNYENSDNIGLDPSSLNKFIDNLNMNISSEEQSSKSSNFQFNDTNSTTNDSNLDSSIERSLSFGYNSNLNDSLNKEEDNPNKKSSNTNYLKNKSTQNESNYTSIEKLVILKPQSKDYILCFDTSSIDQNSSVASNENLAQSSNLSTEIKKETMISSEIKNDAAKNHNEYSDSGVDTARTLSPHGFSQTNTDELDKSPEKKSF